MTEEEITEVESPLGRVLRAAMKCDEVAADSRALNDESRVLISEMRAALQNVLDLVCRLDGLSDAIADLRQYCPACNRRGV